MKRLSLLVVCLVVMGLVASVSLVRAQAPVNVTGKWTMDVVTPKVTGVAVFTLKQDGDKLSGKYAGSLGEAPVTGTIKGDVAVFQFTTDPKKGAAIYTGKVAADGKTMAGDINFANVAKGTFKGKKVK